MVPHRNGTCVILRDACETRHHVRVTLRGCCSLVARLARTCDVAPMFKNAEHLCRAIPLLLPPAWRNCEQVLAHQVQAHLKVCSSSPPPFLPPSLPPPSPQSLLCVYTVQLWVTTIPKDPRLLTRSRNSVRRRAGAGFRKTTSPPSGDTSAPSATFPQSILSAPLHSAAPRSCRRAAGS